MKQDFGSFDRHAPVPTLAVGLAVIVAAMAARQAASPTALAFARIAQRHGRPSLFAPGHGAFHRATARLLTTLDHGSSHRDRT